MNKNIRTYIGDRDKIENYVGEKFINRKELLSALEDYLHVKKVKKLYKKIPKTHSSTDLKEFYDKTGLFVQHILQDENGIEQLFDMYGSVPIGYAPTTCFFSGEYRKLDFKSDNYVDLEIVEEVKEIIEDEKENKITIIYKNYKLKHYKLIRKDVDSDIKRY